MFRRRTSLGSDAATLAQRRLAALAEHLAPAPVLEGEVPDETSQPVPRGGEPGRHRGQPRASELGQWSVSRHHVLVVAIGAGLLVLLGAWWLLRAEPHSQPVRLVSSRSLPPTVSIAPSGGSPVGSPAASPVGAAATSADTVVVDVAGKVRHPGIVELPIGSRIVDALAAAGGPRPGVDTSNLNLARVLVDGEQILVGAGAPGAPMPPPAAGPTTSAAATIPPVDINTATQAQLETLPDVGPVTALSIIDYRTQNGAFATVDQLLDVSGIGEATLADLRPYVYV